MTLAGEAGSLLRIEEEIRAVIAEARALAQRQSAPRQAGSFPSRRTARTGRVRPAAALTRRTVLASGRAADLRRARSLRRAGRKRRRIPAPPLRRRRRAGLRLHRPLPQTLRRGGDESAVWAPLLSSDNVLDRQQFILRRRMTRLLSACALRWPILPMQEWTAFGCDLLTELGSSQKADYEKFREHRICSTLFPSCLGRPWLGRARLG